MSDTMFFTRGRSRGNERRIIVKTATLLVSKPPTLEKRIKMKIVDNLSQGKKGGWPGWIAAPFAFVAENHDTVTPAVLLQGYNVQFSDDNLFAKPVQAVKATMRNFIIDEQGEEDAKDVCLSYLFYAPYSDKLWRWCGQFGGQEIWAAYEQIAEPESEEEELPLDPDEDDSEDIEDEDSSDDQPSLQ